MKIPTTTQTCLMMLACLTLVGCGSDDGGVSPEELLRRKQLRESTTLSKGKTFEQRLDGAREFYDADNLIGAQAELRRLLIIQPDNVDVIFLSAKCHQKEGNVQQAVETLEAIPESNTEMYGEALWLAAGWLADIQDFEGAQQKLEAILEFRNDINRVHHKLAMLLNNQGRRIEAAKHLRFLARSGDIAERELVAMMTYSDLFIDDTLTKPKFRNALVPAVLVNAKYFRAEGDLQRSRELSERLNRKFPESTQISAFLGRVYTDLRADDKIRDWIATAPQGIQREPEYWFAVGSWLQRQSRHKEAVRCFAEAVTRDETDRFSYLGLAKSLTMLGDAEAASRANQRFKLLSEAARITTFLGKQVGAEQQLNRLADILDQLNRPWEAVAWRSILLKTHGGTDDQYAAVKSRRDELAQRETDATTEFLTCGIDLSNWPIPSAADLGALVSTKPAVPAPSLPAVPLVLTDVADQLGLKFQYLNGDDPNDDSRLLHQLTGGGIGVIDFDLDGWPDLYLTQGGGDAFDADGSQPNRAFRNLDGHGFADISIATGTGDLGYGQGVAVADLNQDGFPDLIVANIGANVVYRNNGDGTFLREWLPAVPDNGLWTTSVACGDISGDQLPEIVEVNYIDDATVLETACTPRNDVCKPSVFQSAIDRVWQVNSAGELVAWDGCQEMSSKPNYGFAAVIANFDNHAGNDVFIANDTERNHFWVSRQREDSTSYSLTESAQIRGCASGILGQRQGCMGVAQGDFNRDGSLDLHVTNYWKQAADLYLQQSAGFFGNGNSKRGLYDASRMTVGWGTQAIDFDRNGWLDLAVLNGHVTDHRHRGEPFNMRPQLFRGDVGGFELVEPQEVSSDYWSTPTLGRTMATIDFNRDAKPDLVTNHLDVPLALLENQTDAARSIQLELVGTRSERDAVGATIVVTCGDQSWTGWVIGGDGFLCSNEQVVDFGIGSATVVDRVDVTWPSGHTQQFRALAAGTRYLIVEGDDAPYDRVIH